MGNPSQDMSQQVETRLRFASGYAMDTQWLSTASKSGCNLPNTLSPTLPLLHDATDQVDVWGLGALGFMVLSHDDRGPTDLAGP